MRAASSTQRALGDVASRAPLRAGFVLDLDRCTGCSACAFACRIENDLPPGVSYRQVTTFNPNHTPGLPVVHLSLACNHCDNPACMDACPTAAYTKDPLTRAVVLDETRCMGCTYCSWVCPYGAPQFDVTRGVMTKCTFCASRVERGQQPACVVACPVDALNVLDGASQGASTSVNDASRARDHACVPGFPDTGLKPAIQLLSRHRVPHWSRDGTMPLEIGVWQWQRLRKEWPLAVFTGITACLVGWFLGGALGGPVPRPFLFLTLAMGAVLVSTLHLGRPARMWRALRNLRTSWISREIALFSAFVSMAVFFFFAAPPGRLSSWVTGALGLATLCAMDMVYRIRGQAVRAVPHSAMTLLTGLWLAGCLGGHAWLAAPAGAAKLALYLTRHRRAMAPFAWKRAFVPLARLLLGFAIPAGFWLMAGTPLSGAVVAALLLGEALDRLEFYATLEFLGPGRQAKLDATIRTSF